jgi:Cd2+/Zn2+-exporting ATPase
LKRTNHQTEVFRIPALDCPEELRIIQKGLTPLDGIVSLRPDYLQRALHVEFDADRLGADAIRRRLRQIGFSPQAPVPASPAVAWHQPRHLAVVAGGLLLLGAVVLYLLLPASPRWATALAVASTVCSGSHVALAAVRALRLRQVNMHVLMCVAATGAILVGEEFEAATAMWLFGISLWLEDFSRHRARRAVESLVQLMPDEAHRIGLASDDGPRICCGSAEGAPGAPHEHSGTEPVRDVPVGQVRVNDLLLIKPGERVPVDGQVHAGASAVNQAALTGESIPVDKSVGDPLYAGTLNGEGSLQLRVTATADQSSLARITRLVEQAQASRSRTERFVDQFARYYTPTVIALAIGLASIPTLLGWEASSAVGSNHARIWIHRGLVMLVVACPCALVISTPVTVLCGLRRASQSGILIKGGEYLEQAGRLRALAVDKTGTLTYGESSLVAIRPAPGQTAEEVLRIAAALESRSEHPLAAAVVAAARQRQIDALDCENARALRGFGIQGTVDGHACVVANRRYFEQQGVPPGHLAELDVGSEACSVAFVQRDGQLLGALLLTDEPRADARAAVKRWRRMHLSPIVMLTGDREPVAKRVAQAVGIDHVRAGLLPEQKIDIVHQLARSHRHLAMVGDGVNDAPALAAAPLGIALGASASDTALETADVVVLSPQLNRVAVLVELGRRTRRRLHENIFLALAIKATVLLLASLGWATMAMAVAADVGASMLVIFNGMRLLGPVGEPE